MLKKYHKSKKVGMKHGNNYRRAISPFKFATSIRLGNFASHESLEILCYIQAVRHVVPV